jgi:hypothetical protein
MRLSMQYQIKEKIVNQVHVKKSSLGPYTASHTEDHRHRKLPESARMLQVSLGIQLA